ncbi:carbonic anhydrase [Castellaniella sp.]|uniref:carbonic anhydrase n=1 Tax=Castellaniella sp. TaxID=1955812 RepID=UPI002AFEF93D|nr:carbonic anhydrase [Castellaniella sp.]
MHDIQRLLGGFKGFRRRYYQEDPSLYRGLCEGQRPATLLIACCDSRVDPALMLGCEPGELFVVRNVANLVPPYGRGDSHQGVLAAIQFAVEQLAVERIIVLGHSQCGGIRALMEQSFPTRAEAGVVGRWVSVAEAARREVMDRMPGAAFELRCRACEKAAIRVSLRNLESFSCVRERQERGTLSLHGWHFDMACGELEVYSPQADTFLPLCLSGPAPDPVRGERHVPSRESLALQLY